MELHNHNIPRQGSQYCFDGISLRNGRACNMDSLIILERNIGDDYLLLAAVSDGVGSLNHGAYAATALTKGLLGWFSTIRSCDNLEEELHTEILTINREIYTISSERQFETAATASILLIKNDQYIAFNAGDSRIYHFADGNLQQITTDDVSPEGKLTEYIGFEEPPDLHLLKGDVRGGILLVCSDGLYKKMDLDYMYNELSACSGDRISTVIDNLIRFSVQRGESDNISVAVVQRA